MCYEKLIGDGREIVRKTEMLLILVVLMTWKWDRWEKTGGVVSVLIHISSILFSPSLSKKLPISMELNHMPMKYMVNYNVPKH